MQALRGNGNPEVLLQVGSHATQRKRATPLAAAVLVLTVEWHVSMTKCVAHQHGSPQRR